ncbi:MAG: serine palmitoyltransferase component [Vezdaea aestivalis]|nr:MAG: serine palmitoyltransferase component [Vezdaea aestivalis]
MELHDAQILVQDFFQDLSVRFQKVPGSAILLRYIQSSYQNDPIRSAVELFLFLFAVRYLLAPKYSTQKQNYVALSEQEIDELVDDWTPEPLVGPQTALEEIENEKRPVIVGPTGPKTKLSSGRTVTNLASYNFYNFVSNEMLKEKAIQTLRTYGVGPCGPPGFYGTQDVHMKTEADIASFLAVPACIVYAQAFSTISSVIPAFSKRGDIIVASTASNFAIRKGIQISRSTVRWYAHNDMADLERVLASITKEQASKPLTRRFIIAESLSDNVGDLTPLAAMLALKHRYKFRLILDESWSFGVLGRTGRGATEHAGVSAADVDMIIGSLAGPLCAGGGFCAGSEEIVEHQRISAAAYTFSAALPAMLATMASETLNLLQLEPGVVATLREAGRTMRAQLDPRSEWVRCVSAVENPVLFLVVKDEVVRQRRWTNEEVAKVLQEVVDETLQNGVLITRLRTMPAAQQQVGKETPWLPPPALKVCVTVGLSRKELEKAGTHVRHAVTKIMTRKR